MQNNGELHKLPCFLSNYTICYLMSWAINYQAQHDFLHAYNTLWNTVPAFLVD